MLLNVLDYPTPAAALTAAEDGDRIYFPGLSPYVAPPGGWKIAKSLDVFGDGPGIPGFGTVLRAFDADSPVMELIPPASNVSVREMQLQRGGAGPGSGVGVLCRSTIGNPSAATGLRFRGIKVAGFPGNGIHLEGLNGDTAAISSVGLLDLDVNDCGGVGIFLKNAYDVQMADCTLSRNQLNGLSATGGTLAVRACTFDGNVLAATFPPGSDPQFEGNLKASACEMVDIDGCRFLNLQNGVVRKGCVLVDTCGQVGNCQFDSTSFQVECHGIELTGSQGGPFVIMGNRFNNVTRLIVLGVGVTGCAIYPQYEDSTIGSIVIPEPNNGAYGAPHIVRISEFVFRGLQLPVLDSDPNPYQPVEGMLAYNSQSGLRLLTSNGWRSVSTVPTPP